MSINQIPEPPEPGSIVIDHKAAENLEKWISFFKSLSPRIRIFNPANSNIVELHEQLRREAIEHHGADEEYYELLWPHLEQVAFIILINVAKPGQFEKFSIGNKFIFLFKNVAFGLNYFSLEGDPEEDMDRHTYSTREMTESALSWEYVGLTIIPSRIEEAEKCVPDFPRR